MLCSNEGARDPRDPLRFPEMTLFLSYAHFHSERVIS
jgi:hypothetical protein